MVGSIFRRHVDEGNVFAVAAAAATNLPGHQPVASLPFLSYVRQSKNTRVPQRQRAPAHTPSPLNTEEEQQRAGRNSLLGNAAPGTGEPPSGAKKRLQKPGCLRGRTPATSG